MRSDGGVNEISAHQPIAANSKMVVHESENGGERECVWVWET